MLSRKKFLSIFLSQNDKKKITIRNDFTWSKKINIAEKEIYYMM